MIQLFVRKKNSMRLVVVLLICCFPAFSQKAIQLTNITSGKKQIIKEGQRVEFTTKYDHKHYVGILHTVTVSAITIQDKTYPLDDLTSLGRRRKGSGFWAFTSGAVGAGLIIGAIANSTYDPCPDCEGDDGSNPGITAAEVGLGLAVLGLGINTVVRNSPRDLVKKWKLEIVDAPID